MFWTDERVESLKNLWIDDLNASQIADKLGGVTSIDVTGQAHRLGLSDERGNLTPIVFDSMDRRNSQIDIESLRFALRRRRKDGHPLAIYLTIYTLERLVRELLPFYGLDCPIALVLDSEGTGGRVLRGTLATIEGWTTTKPLARSMLVLVG